MRIRISLLFFIAFISFSFAQEKEHPESNFDKYEAFSPLFLNELSNSFHSATGEPGPNYWQNKADYSIKATLDTINNKVSGQLELTYTNNSPYTLDFIWLQMDQNAFRDDSRSKALYPANDRNGVRTPTQGFELQEVKVGKKETDYSIDDTRMQIRLDKPLKPNGKKVKINIAYSFEIPTHGKDRMGRVETKNGWIYTLAQWYPRVAVFDEVEGWNNLPYLGTGEFYLEYGDFNIEITAPENMVVVASGELKNERQVLTKTQQNRLKKARESDETVMIRTKEEMQNESDIKSGKEGMLTWKFKINNSRDVAWAASKAFIWDAAKMNLPDNKTGLAQSVYPEENSGQDGYARSTEYTKNAIEIYSKDWFPYPYKVATNVGAHEGGMEYPGIVFCSYESKGSSLWGVVNHEFGHIWFPMIVGSNERVYAWLDEGLNTFINDVATEKFNNGEYQETKNAQEMGAYLFHETWDPLFTRADVIHSQQKLGIEAYYKPAAALNVLRNVVLGEDRFDYAIQTYIQRWKYKHPQPWDFFNTMSNVSGEDLGWFFKAWFMKNWALDQSVESIDYNENDPKKGATITLLNREKMPMPVTLKVVYADGSSEIIDLPVEIWMTGPEYIYHLDSSQKIVSAEIDPEGLVPDSNPANNFLKKLEEAPDGITAGSILKNFLDKTEKNDKNIEDVTLKMKTVIQGTPFNITDHIKTPDKYSRKMEVFGQQILELKVNGDEVLLKNQGKTEELGEADKEYLRSLPEAQFIEQMALAKEYESKLLGIDKIKDEKVYVVQITTPDKITYTNSYSIDSGLKLQEKDSNGFLKIYDDYKDVDGFITPHTIKEILFGFGQEVEMKVSDIKVNSALKDSLFSKE